MPRFHFDVIDDDRFTDHDGVEFADAKTMRADAMRGAGSMVGEIVDFPLEPWTMVIRDEARKPVATLTFSARLA